MKLRWTRHPEKPISVSTVSELGTETNKNSNCGSFHIQAWIPAQNLTPTHPTTHVPRAARSNGSTAIRGARSCVNRSHSDRPYRTREQAGEWGEDTAFSTSESDGDLPSAAMVATRESFWKPGGLSEVVRWWKEETTRWSGWASSRKEDTCYLELLKSRRRIHDARLSDFGWA